MELIKEGRAVLVGPVRQEILSGLRDKVVYDRLLAYLRAFQDEPVRVEDFEEASHFFNICQTHGVTGTPTDLLLCAISHRAGLPIFTTDSDFTRYQKHLPIRLRAPRKRDI